MKSVHRTDPWASAENRAKQAIAALPTPWLALCGLVVLLVWGAAGCAPAQPTATVIGPVPATALAPSQPTSVLPKSVAAPPSPTVALRLPTATRVGPVARPTGSIGQSVAWSLSILHTNDVRGYLDPCG